MVRDGDLSLHSQPCRKKESDACVEVKGHSQAALSGTREEWGSEELEKAPFQGSATTHMLSRMKLPTFKKHLKPGTVLEFHNFKILSTLFILKQYPSIKILKH